MGFNYSLCLIMKRGDSELLLDSLLPLLDSRSRDRIGLSRWSPESESTWATCDGASEVDARGIAGIKLEKGEFPNSYCFALQIQLERELESFFPEHHFTCFDRPGSFGCMWTSVYAGREYIKVEMAAATSGMSLVLQQSRAVHALWITLARRTLALFAYIDVEESAAIQLFPSVGDLTLPGNGPVACDGDQRFSVDHMVTHLLANTTA